LAALSRLGKKRSHEKGSAKKG